MAVDVQSASGPDAGKPAASNGADVADDVTSADPSPEVSDPTAQSAKPDLLQDDVDDGSVGRVVPQQRDGQAPDQPVPTMSRYAQDVTTPSGTLAVRLFSRMQGDLSVLTEGRRAATREEVRKALLHAVRIEAPERLQQVMATANTDLPAPISPGGPGSTNP